MIGTEAAPEKVVVRSFYEEVGWMEDASSHLYMDACLFEDLRLVSAEYRVRANRRVREALCQHGDLLLDVASGPIQYDDYFQFSHGYRKRVCVDLSMRALQGARRRIGDAGLFVQADITSLPFKSNAFDGIVSLHTVYHVPAAEQTNALQELQRTLKPARRAVVVYKWQPSVLKRLLAFPFNLVDAVKKLVLQVPGVRPAVRRAKLGLETRDGKNQLPFSAPRELPPLYFHAHKIAWFRQQVTPPSSLEVRCWRSLEVPVMKRLPDDARGKRVLRFVQMLEDRFPHLFGRIGSYPLIVIAKDGRGLRSDTCRTTSWPPQMSTF